MTVPTLEQFQSAHLAPTALAYGQALAMIAEQGNALAQAIRDKDTVAAQFATYQAASATERDALARQLAEVAAKLAACEGASQPPPGPVDPNRPPPVDPQAPATMLGAPSTVTYDPAKAGHTSRALLPRRFLDTKIPDSLGSVRRLQDFTGSTAVDKFRTAMAQRAAGKFAHGDVLVVPYDMPLSGTVATFDRPADSAQRLYVFAEGFAANYKTQQGTPLGPTPDTKALGMTRWSVGAAANAIRVQGKRSSGLYFGGFDVRLDKAFGTGIQGYALAQVGLGAGQTSLGVIPEDVTFARCRFGPDQFDPNDFTLAGTRQQAKRGVGMHCIAGALVDCCVRDFYVKGQDAQAISMSDGPGPFKYVGNYTNAGGENWMAGGDDPSLPGLHPSDIEMRRNWHDKHLALIKAVAELTIKNSGESKNSMYGLDEGSVYSGIANADGSGALNWWKSEDQQGLGAGQEKYAETGHWTLRHNLYLDAPTALSIASTSGGNTADDYLRALHDFHVYNCALRGSRAGDHSAFARVSGNVEGVTFERVDDDSPEYGLWLTGGNARRMAVVASAIGARAAVSEAGNSVEGVPDGLGGLKTLWPGVELTQAYFGAAAKTAPASSKPDMALLKRAVDGAGGWRAESRPELWGVP